jgi:hypothetical protein
MHHASENVVTHVVSRIQGERRRSPNFKLVFPSFFPVVRHFLLSINIIKFKTSNGILQLVPEP